jgi:hypothetical protein
MDTQNYYRCITDCWRYFQKYSDPVNSDAWWKQLVDEGSELTEKYGYAEFVVDLVGAIQREIERIWKRRKNHNE